MLIFRSISRAAGLGLVALALAGGGISSIEPVAAQQARLQPRFKSPEAAYEQGMGAWRSGFIEHAIPALRFAADSDVFLAQFYLARIYSDSGTPYTDHVAAYRLYKRIADEHANIDPDDDQRRPFVARALTALAGYVRQGLPQVSLRPDPRGAVEYLRHAAQFFNDEEAQFELAKTYLQGDGVPQDTRAGLHWLSTLTQKGHAAAQAFLADIYWRGRYSVIRDPTRAFALISVAVENAPDSERVWIEDIYQHIYCGAPAGTRTQAQGMVADWRQRYGRAAPSTRSALGPLVPQAERTCSNGEAVKPLPPRSQHPSTSPVPTGPMAKTTPSGVLDVGVTGSTLAPR